MAEKHDKGVGDPYDPDCKAASLSFINRKVCRNNCKFWNGKSCVKGFK